jgi:methionyl-tRNA formyltransferase
VRILFAGSPQLALPSLEAIAVRHDIVGVLTNPPTPKGRGLALSPTPVAERAASLLPGVPLLAPQKLGQAERELVDALKPDILVVYAYGRIFGPKFLSLFPLGGINAHPSLLPRWRGCAPIPYAILNRDERTGLCIQRVAREMDSGDILDRVELPLRGDETTESLSAWAAEAGASALLRVLSAIESGTERAEPQDSSRASYCAAIHKDDGLISWDESPELIYAKLRAYSPWPGVWTTMKGERLSILGMEPCDGEAPGAAGPAGAVLRVDKARGILVKAGGGVLALTALQLRGKKAMGFKDFCNGVRGLEGLVLGA